MQQELQIAKGIFNFRKFEIEGTLNESSPTGDTVFSGFFFILVKTLHPPLPDWDVKDQ